MSKKKYIKLEVENPGFVFGVASNEKIWKLCWEINQELELNLAAESPEFAGEREGYSDRETDSNFEYFLLENNRNDKKIPRMAREFRFWFIIKPLKDLTPDLPKLKASLNKIAVISLAIDLSSQQDINKLIP
ncbi:MAG: hypothetical protein H6581_06490 [Bacteroidia bacterium]|nr:hypothetical protein [Bacteroidia bacterium]